MAKPMIVAMALRKARADGQPLSAEHTEEARNAIIHSDNDAASALWSYAGYQNYPTLAAELGMKTLISMRTRPISGAGPGPLRPTR